MKLSLAALSFLALPAQAQVLSEFPTGLLGIELGSTYSYSPDSADGSAAGVFPVARLVSEPVSVHEGVSLYFEPLSENATAPFRELAPENSRDSAASYRIFVFPVIPDETRNFDDLQERDLDQTVTMIEWSRRDGRINDNDEYRWAHDLCSKLEADLGLQPEVTDIVDRNLFRCLFTFGERELEVTSVLGQTIQLSLADEIEDQMATDVHWVLWGLKRGISAEATRKRRSTEGRP